MSRKEKTPHELTMAWLKKYNPSCVLETVEHTSKFDGKKHDLFGFADILMVTPKGACVLYQATVMTKMNERVKKIRASKDWKFLIDAGFLIYVMGWMKVGDAWRNASVTVGR